MTVIERAIRSLNYEINASPENDISIYHLRNSTNYASDLVTGVGTPEVVRGIFRRLIDRYGSVIMTTALKHWKQNSNPAVEQYHAYMRRRKQQIKEKRTR